MEINMQNMIKRIIDMDKRARELTADAKAKKAGSAAAIERKKEEARHGFLDRAQRRVDVIEQSEMEEADEQMKLIKSSADRAAERLEQIYGQNHTAWVDEIVSRVVKGDDLI